MSTYDCVIIGSGPAGLATAFALLETKPDVKILLLEKEKVSSGGLRNDCKMNFTWPIGFPTEYWDATKTKKYLDRAENFLSQK